MKTQEEKQIDFFEDIMDELRAIELAHERISRMISKAIVKLADKR